MLRSFLVYHILYTVLQITAAITCGRNTVPETFKVMSPYIVAKFRKVTKIRNVVRYYYYVGMYVI